MWTVGPVLGTIQDVPTCQVLLSRIEKDAMDTIANIEGFIAKGSKL